MTDTDTNPSTVTRTVHADTVVTREVDDADIEMLRVPVSSTRPDREGDRFARDALEDMADQIRSQNPMVFDNHGLAGNYLDAIPYDARETIGAQMDAEVEHAEDGEYDLFAYVNPDGTHPEGERMLKQVRDEAQPIKFSVGFGVKGYDDREEVEDDYEGDGRVFTSADHMETSRVGIPANPDASVTQSAEAKDGVAALPGYRNHPIMQLMANANTEDAPDVAAKDAVDSDTVEDATPTRVDGQGENVTRDADDPEKVEGGCDGDADCPEGEVCVDGECIPEDELEDDPEETDGTCPECGAEVDDDANFCPSCGEELAADTPDDTDSEVPDAVRDLREENAALREEIADVREQVQERGDPDTGPTDMEASDPRTDAEKGAEEPDETNDSGSGLLG